MTFFLEGPEEIEMPKVDQPQTGVPSFFDGLGAAFRAAQIENDSNFRVSSEARGVTAEKARSAAQRLDQEELDERLKSRGVYRGNLSIDEIVGVNSKAAAVVLDAAREQAALQPDAWSEMGISEDAIQQEVNARLQADWQETQDILSMMPGGRTAAGLLGGIAGMTADVKNIPFLIAGGGGGSFLRTMGREAFINMSAEAAFMPAQFDAAERLDIPDPSIATQLSMAAAGGAILGGMMEGVSRGVIYWQGRSRAPTIPGYSNPEAAALLDSVEDALAEGRDPVAAAESIRPSQPVPPPGREPLVLRPEDRIEVSPIRAEPDADLIASAEAAIDTAQGEINAAVKDNSLIKWMRTNHLTREGRQNVKNGNPSLQVHPDGELGALLKQNDIRIPGLLSRSGLKEFDNLVASEMEAKFPGIREATNTAADATYLDRDGFMDIVLRAARGDYDWMPDVADARRRIDEADRAIRGTPQEDFLAKRESGFEDGLYIDLNRYNFDVGALQARMDIGDAVDRYIDRKGFGDILTPQERAEIVYTAQENGGDVDFLIERVLEREADYVDAPDVEEPDIPFGEPSRPDGQGAPREADAPEAGSRVEGAQGRGPDAFEETPAGQQRLIPGVEPITPSQRLAQRQDAPLRGGDRPMDEGLFDTGARAQMDIFDEPVKARPIHDTMAADIRTDIEKEGDFILDMGDGRGARPVSEVLDDLDNGDTFADVIATCGAKDVV